MCVRVCEHRKKQSIAEGFNLAITTPVPLSPLCTDLYLPLTANLSSPNGAVESTIFVSPIPSNHGMFSFYIWSFLALQNCHSHTVTSHAPTKPSFSRDLANHIRASLESCKWLRLFPPNTWKKEGSNERKRKASGTRTDSLNFGTSSSPLFARGVSLFLFWALIRLRRYNIEL